MTPTPPKPPEPEPPTPEDEWPKCPDCGEPMVKDYRDAWVCEYCGAEDEEDE